MRSLSSSLSSLILFLQRRSAESKLVMSGSTSVRYCWMYEVARMRTVMCVRSRVLLYSLKIWFAIFIFASILSSFFVWRMTSQSRAAILFFLPFTMPKTGEHMRYRLMRSSTVSPKSGRSISPWMSLPSLPYPTTGHVSDCV